MGPLEEKNVRDLQGQVQNAYVRIDELVTENARLQRIIEAQKGILAILQDELGADSDESI